MGSNNTKVTTGALGGALAILAVWILKDIVGIDVPGEAGAAIALILTAGLQYVKAPL